MEKNEMQSRGGQARATKLSHEERKAIAREAAIKRWSTNIPRATHMGEMQIGNKKIACAVLDNTTRVLTQETFMASIGRARKARGSTGSSFALVDGLPPFLSSNNLNPFISDDLRQSTMPIPFRTPTGNRAYGFKAELLPMVCEVYLEARDAKALKPNQKHIAIACDILVRSLAKVGIIALVDEATGYQEDRAKNELQRLLAAYIAEELRPWVKTFPNEFFKQIYKIHSWEYRAETVKKPQYVGKFINKYIYDQLPSGVLDELRKRNPVTEKGYRRYRHFQFLTVDTGNPHLDKQITKVITLMQVSDSKESFEDNFKKVFAKEYQHQLPLVVSPTGVTSQT
ncbi:MAG: P63C domain-containing protein [Candidatus Omnitrophota bacterium]